MKVLLLGATGRTGKLALQKALQQGYEVHVLVRDAGKIKAEHPHLKVFEGDPSKSEDMSEAMEGCEAVISVLNISRTSDFPWAPLRTPRTYLSAVMRLLLVQAVAFGLKRVVICSAWGVAETRPELPGWFRWLVDHSHIGVAYEDHERQEQLVMNSSLDWTIVRPVGLTNGTRSASVRKSFGGSPKPTLTISRLAVAAFMVGCLREEDTIGKAITLSSSKE